MQTTAIATGAAIRLDADYLAAKIESRSFCTLATASTDGSPHAAAVLYVVIDDVLYVNTSRRSRKARNIADNSRVSVCIPIRRVPIGPPSSVQFAAEAAILTLDHPEIVALLARDALRSITSHGELDEPDSCFLRIVPTGRINTYGLGMPLRQLIRDPLHGAGSVTSTRSPHRASSEPSGNVA